MKQDLPIIKPMGERGILIEFESEIREDLLHKILYFKNKLEEFYIEEKLEVINTYNSLLINYLYPIEDVYGEVSALKEVFSKNNVIKETPSSLFKIPVCYDKEFGLDLDLISREKGLTSQEVIQLHTAPVYTVYFIGFLPGFLYLGGLDKKLRISRKNQPRMKIDKGAVGIGENQTGIYPQSSPGGWQIIGNCPVPFFDKNERPPCSISAGDKLKFYSVSKTEFQKISGEVSEGEFQFKEEIYHG